MIRATPSAALTSSIPQRAHLVLVEQPAPKARDHIAHPQAERNYVRLRLRIPSMRSLTSAPLAAATNSIESTR